MDKGAEWVFSYINHAVILCVRVFIIVKPKYWGANNVLE
jgi:hypothetical protein